MWRSWDRASWYISIVKPTRRTIFEFIEYHSTCFGRSFSPSSGVQDCKYSIRYMSNRYCWMLASGQEVPASKQSTTTVWHIPDAVFRVLNSWWWTKRPPETCRVIFNKLENCVSSWFYYRNISRCTVPWTSKNNQNTLPAASLTFTVQLYTLASYTNKERIAQNSHELNKTAFVRIS